VHRLIQKSSQAFISFICDEQSISLLLISLLLI